MATQGPNPTSVDNIPFDEIVGKLVPDPANNISYSIIYGLIGKSVNENCIRVYFNESLSKYADIPKDSIKHYEAASSDKAASKKCKLWVVSDAKVELQSSKAHNSVAAKFLSGNIYNFQNQYPGDRGTDYAYCSTNYVDCGPQPSDDCTHSSSCGEATGSCSNYCTAGRCVPTHGGCYDVNQRNRGTDHEYCSTSYIDCGPQPSDSCTHSSSCGEGTGSCSNYCTAGRCVPTHGGCYDVNQRNRGTDYAYCSTNYVDCGPQPSDDCTHSSSCGEATGSCSNYCTAGRCAPTHGGCYNPKQNWPIKRYNSTFSPYNRR